MTIIMNNRPFSYRLAINSNDEFITMADNIKTYGALKKIARTLFKVNPTHETYDILSAENGYWYGNIHRFETELKMFKDKLK